MKRRKLKASGGHLTGAAHRDTASLQILMGHAAAAFQAGRFEEVMKLSRKITEVEPNHPEALQIGGLAAFELGDAEQAIAMLRAAVTAKSGSADAHVCLGIVLKAMGRPSEAEEAYRAALAIDPADATTNLNLGNVLKALGKLEEAEAAYRRAISAQPTMADAYQYLTSLKTYESVDDDVQAMENQLSDPSLGDEQGMHLNFALAKIYDDLGQCDRAFAHMSEANRLKRNSIDYDIAKDEERADRIKAVFDPALLASRDGQGCPSDIPIFIVGMPRSGTTLVEQILASHSEVFGGGELTELDRIVEGIREPGASSLEFPEAVPKTDSESLSRLGRNYVDAVRTGAPESPRITDKATLNFWHVGLIHLILPGAKIINCVRDPLDTCFSCYQQLFVGSLDFTYSLVDLGRYHRLYERLMDHWHRVLPGAVLDVHYERLVADQKPETRRILDFCGLDWEDGCLAFHETPRPVFTLSSTDVRRPIYSSAIGRWKPYRTHLEPLTKIIKAGVD